MSPQFGYDGEGFPMSKDVPAMTLVSPIRINADPAVFRVIVEERIVVGRVAWSGREDGRVLAFKNCFK